MVLDSIMENANEMSSSLSFASSSYLSNGSTNHPASPELCSSLDNLSLSKLSSNLEKLLLDAEYDYTDAEIVVEGKSVAVHRCILSARSQFFHELFKKGNNNDGSAVSEGKPKYLMTELVPYGKVGYEAFNVILYYFYTGKLKPSPSEVSTCVDDACAHDACPPAINYAIELMYASAAFQMKELVLLFQISYICSRMSSCYLVSDNDTSFLVNDMFFYIYIWNYGSFIFPSFTFLTSIELPRYNIFYWRLALDCEFWKKL